MSRIISAAALAVALSATAAHGAVLFSDSFTAADGTTMIGRSPDVTDVPASTYAGNGGNNYANSILGNRATLAVDEGAAIATGVTATTVYTISDLFNDGNIGGADQNDRGEGLGFFTSVSQGNNGFHGDSNFTGVTVSPAGLVSLISVTQAQAITTYATATVAGYNVAADHTLSYAVNTSTGLISGVTVDGAAIPLIGPAGLFTPADTALAGFTASANALGESATYDNFVLSAAVPEPTVLGPVALAAVALVRRRRQAK